MSNSTCTGIPADPDITGIGVSWACAVACTVNWLMLCTTDSPQLLFDYLYYGCRSTKTFDGKVDRHPERECRHHWL